VSQQRRDSKENLSTERYKSWLLAHSGFFFAEEIWQQILAKMGRSIGKDDAEQQTEK
jgi:hypothetical protein